MKIAISVPSGDMVHADFMACLFALFSHERHNQTFYVNTRSSLIQQGRFMLVRAALNAQADKMLFIDSDMSFPADALSRLIAHDKPIVGATYLRRRNPWGLLGYYEDGYEIQASSDNQGLKKVGLLPLGFMLIDSSVFSKVDCPWFCVGFDLEKDLWTSEDYGFCTGARQAGYEIWCDFDLSREIGHIGLHTYMFQDAINREEFIDLPR